MKEWPKAPALVEVLWEDHYSMGDDWYDQSYPHDPCILYAVGYLVSEDDKYYYIACTYEPSTKRYSAGSAVLKNCVIGFRQYDPLRVVREEKRPASMTKGRVKKS